MKMIFQKYLKNFVKNNSQMNNVMIISQIAYNNRFNNKIIKMILIKINKIIQINLPKVTKKMNYLLRKHMKNGNN